MQFVSVIMPYYRKKKYVKDAIHSVINQSYKDIELIIVYDDKETQDFEFLKNITLKYNNVRIIRNSENVGAGQSRNNGIKNAKGNLIAFIDADDFWYREKIDKQVSFLIEKNLDFVFCDYLRKKQEKTRKIICKKNVLTYKDLLYSCDVGLLTVLIKKNIIQNNLFPQLKTKEDFVTWLKIAKQGIYPTKVNEILAVWNDVDGSLSSNVFQKILDGYRVYRQFQNLSFMKSLYYLFFLSINSLKK